MQSMPQEENKEGSKVNDIVKFVPKNKEADAKARKDHLCSILDELKEDIQKGDFTGFLILGFSPDGSMYRWQDIENMTNDMLIGKLEMLQHIIIQRDCV